MRSSNTSTAWLQTARHGFCAATEVTNSCDGQQGSFALDQCESSSWSLAVDACLGRCSSCAHCQFISVSLKHRDCSWFSSAIDCSTLKHDVKGFRSGPLERQAKPQLLAHAAPLAARCSTDRPGNAAGAEPDEGALRQELAEGTVVLRTGARMPRLGFGTASTTEVALRGALEAGYRLIDTAVYYGNEAIVRRALSRAGVERTRIFLISKAWPFAPGQRGRKKSDVSGAELAAQVRAHVAALGAGWLDLLLVHWPTDRLEEHWRALLALRRKGVVRALGLSNANLRHVQALEAARLPPPVLLQTELAPLRKDARVDSSGLEALIAACEMRRIQLMSHSPLKAALADERARSLARSHNVSVAQLLLRYGLQRNFVEVFGSRSTAHQRANRHALLGFELPATTMRAVACWRGEEIPACERLLGAVGRQSPLVERQLVGDAAASEVPDAARRIGGMDGHVRLAPGETDPIHTLGLRDGVADANANGSDGGGGGGGGGGDELDELRAAAKLHAPAPGMRALAPLSAHAVTHADIAARCGVGVPPRCAFQLAVLRPDRETGGGGVGRAIADGPAASWAGSSEYLSLVANLSRRAAQLFNGGSDEGGGRRLVRVQHGGGHGIGAQHVRTLVKPRATPGVSEALEALETRFILPYLASLYGRAAQFRSVRVSRNEPLPQGETLRTRSMLWHWDNGPEAALKLILYLSDVDHTRGCMATMLHNASGKPLKIRATAAPFGPKVFPNVPTLWMTELLDSGYRRACLAALAGSVIAFDTNIVHRGTRPASGKHRDFVLWEARPVGRSGGNG